MEWGERGKGEGVTVRNELVLETDVKGRVRVRGECHPRLAGEVLGFPVFVADGVADL